MDSNMYKRLNCTQQEEGSFYGHIGLGIEEETGGVLHLKQLDMVLKLGRCGQ